MRIHEQQRGSPARPLGPRASPPALGEANLMKLVSGLADGFPERTFGTPQAERAARWMATQLADAGCRPVDGSFVHHFDWPMGEEVWRGHNVAGLVEGSDPKLKDEYILVTAHHDSQQDTKAGANDNASGCAAVVALAQELAKNPPKRSVIFMTFDGEEGMRIEGKYHGGRRGSQAYAEAPLVPLDKTAMLVNMDMLGQVHLEKGSRKDVFKWASNDPFAKGVLRAASDAALRPDEQGLEGYPEQPLEGQFFTTDAEPLYRLNVPVLNFLSGRDLDNHHPDDDGDRIIPERMTQYARLVHACVLEAGNEARSLTEMGIRPGQKKVDYELIRARKTTGTRTVDEEKMRLGALASRLPELREAALGVVEKAQQPEVAGQLGVDIDALVQGTPGLVSEPALAKLRDAQSAAADAFRELPKDDDRRAPAQQSLSALTGMVDVVAAAVFLRKLDKKSDYYLARIPEALADLDRGARRLGLAPALDRVVQDGDLRAFLPEVDADRAVSIARDALGELGQAAGRAARALLDPKAAVVDDRGVEEGDLEAAAADIAQKLGPIGPDEGRIAAFSAVADTLLAGVRGSGDKWVERFRAKNMLSDVQAAARLIDGDSAPLNAAARGLEQALSQGEGLEGAIVDFWTAATEATLGPAAEAPTLDEVIALGDPQRRQVSLQEGQRSAAAQRVEADPGAARALEARQTLVGSALALQTFFSPKSGALREDASLIEVHRALDKTACAAGEVEGGAPIRQELEFWKSWLEPFLELERPAQAQAQARTESARAGLQALKPLWPKVAGRLATKMGLDEATLASPNKTLKALQGRARVDGAPARLARAALGQVRPFVNAERALSTSLRTASPKAVAELGPALDGLAAVVGEEAVAAVRAEAQDLLPSRAGPVAKMGREGARSGPMRLLDIRRRDRS